MSWIAEENKARNQEGAGLAHEIIVMSFRVIFAKDWRDTRRGEPHLEKVKDSRCFPESIYC